MLVVLVLVTEAEIAGASNLHFFVIGATVAPAPQNIPVNTHVILLFDCCRGKKSVEMANVIPPRFQLHIKPSELDDLKNVDLKNSYTFHATLPNQVC